MMLTLIEAILWSSNNETNLNWIEKTWGEEKHKTRKIHFKVWREWGSTWRMTRAEERDFCFFNYKCVALMHVHMPNENYPVKKRERERKKKIQKWERKEIKTQSWVSELWMGARALMADVALGGAGKWQPFTWLLAKVNRFWQCDKVQFARLCLFSLYLEK